VRDSTEGEFGEVSRRVRGLLESRLAGLREQLGELTELRGKNKGVVEYMMGKVKSEKDEFEVALQRYYAVRSVFTNLTNKLFGHLGLDQMRGLTKTTREKMLDSNFTLGLSGAMHGYFMTLRGKLSDANKEVAEVMAMMDAIYKKFRVEHGLKLGTPTAFSLLRYEKELARLERWCNENLNTPINLLTLEKRVVTQRFFEEVAVQIRRTFEHANQDAEIWLKSIMAPMESQVREHQMQLKRRLESIKRIHMATDNLDERISELTHTENSLASQIASMQQIAEQVESRLKAAGFISDRRRAAA
jgi:hypothetical protein